jgi:peptidoglycan/LPS O-acetylase OafA/YrhL
MTAKAGRFQHIDGLRGIAAMAVIVQHVFEKILESRPDVPAVREGLEAVLLHGCNLGRFGVMLFFLISGFVIPFSFRGETPIRNFAISRVFRLYPCYWLSILFAVGVGAAVGLHYSAPRIAANLTMVQRLLGQEDIRVAYWTLFLELCFYALAAGLFWLKLLNRSDVLIGAALILILLAVVPSLVRNGLGIWVPAKSEPIFLSFMFTGAVIRRAMEDREPVARRWLPLLIGAQIIGSILLAGIPFPVIDNKNIYFAPVPLLTGPIAALLLFLFAVKARRPVAGVLSFLGLVSYSLYLNQGVVLTTLEIFAPPTGTLGSELLFLAAAVLASIALSAVTYRLLEHPFIQLGRRFTHRAVPRVAAEVAP